MQSLQECYCELSKEPKSIFYYPEVGDVIDALKTPENSLGFIKKYFTIGAKGKVLSRKDITDNEESLSNRSQHILSTYLLGIKIAGIFDIPLDEAGPYDPGFLYLWALTCLYHDVGYIFEKPSLKTTCLETHLKRVSEDGIDGFKDAFDVSLIGDSVFRSYSRSTVELYLKGRTRDCEHQGIDHGIAGGLLLYDRLRSQFEHAFEERPRASESRKYFTCRNPVSGVLDRYCSYDHFEKYAEAADAIISHNIFKDTLEKYYKEEFLKTAPSGLFVKMGRDNPLGLILAIADSTEPIKETTDASLLNSVFIEQAKAPKSFTIRIRIVEGNTDLVERIKGLENWVDVSVEQITDTPDEVVFKITANATT